MSENELREALLQSEAARERLMGALEQLLNTLGIGGESVGGSMTVAACIEARAALSTSPSAALAEREAGLKARIAQPEKERDDARAIERAAARVMLVGTLATYGIEAHDDGNVLHIDSADPLRERLKQEREAERWATATAFDEAFGTCVPLTSGETITADAFRRSRESHDAKVRAAALEEERAKAVDSTWLKTSERERMQLIMERDKLHGALERLIQRICRWDTEAKTFDFIISAKAALASTPSETKEPK